MGSTQRMHQPGKKLLSANPVAGAVRDGQHTPDTGINLLTMPWVTLKAQALSQSPWKPKPPKIMSLTSLTSRLEMSIRTAKLVIWLHWQAIWLWFLENSSHPLEDQAPVPPILWGKKAFLRAILWSPLAFHCYCPLWQLVLHNQRGQ